MTDEDLNLALKCEKESKGNVFLAALLAIKAERGRDSKAELLAYHHAHETALSLGYPSLTEALEALESYDAAIARAVRAAAERDGPERQAMADAMPYREGNEADNAQSAAEITRLRARVAELEATQQWQPIETAPKNGTKVLVARFKTGCKHDGHMAVDWFRRPGDNAGFLGFGRFNTQNWPATHWMPLPAPPKGTAHDPR